jgi:hypothetical protein
VWSARISRRCALASYKVALAGCKRHASLKRAAAAVIVTALVWSARISRRCALASHKVALAGCKRHTSLKHAAAVVIVHPSPHKLQEPFVCQIIVTVTALLPL